MKNKVYLVEILCLILCILLGSYMVDTWKRMTPETESEAEILVLASDSEGDEL